MNEGHTCRLRKFVLQNLCSESPLEEARRQLENALCIVRKSELSVIALVEVWIFTREVERTSHECAFGPISFPFVTERCEKWGF